MKITIKPKKEKAISISKIEPGTVFEFNDNTVGLKLNNDQVLLLNFSDGDTWLDLAGGYLDKPTKKILGQLTEIIVE